MVVEVLAVEVLGAVSGGSQRWLDLGFIRLQPSELMKLAVVLATARYYSMLPAGQVRTWTAVWPPVLLFGIPFVLVLLQPDLGTGLMIAAGGVTVMFLAGIPLRLFVGTAVIGAAALPVASSVSRPPTLRAMNHADSHANGGGQMAVAFQERGRDDGRSLEVGGDVAYALTAPSGGGRAQERNILTPAMQVRRLTPVECERLQGFPDNYTDIPWRKKEHSPDGPRYKALGNSMAVPVMQVGKMGMTVDHWCEPVPMAVRFT